MWSNGGIQRRQRSIGWMLAALFAPLLAVAQTATVKIGYVDMRRLLDNAPQVAAGRMQIEADFRGRDLQLKAEQTRLDELEQRERRDAAVLPKTAADALHREIETLKRGIERTRRKLNEDLKTRRDEELNRRWPVINDAVIQYARENGFDLVVPAPQLYASASIDITDEVLARLRSQAAQDGSP